MESQALTVPQVGATGDEYFTVKEVAGRLRVSMSTVIRLISTGELAAIRVGRLYRVAGADLERWRAEQGRRVQEAAERVAQMFPPRRRR